MNDSKSYEIKTIDCRGVNCYLVKSAESYFLIDSGFAFRRKLVEKALAAAGCQPGNLKLILITHGDSDHTGNVAYLREKYGALILLHAGESEVAERGDMILSRKNRPLLMRIVLPFFKLAKPDRFKADLIATDGQDLSENGLDATILHIPGHSMGSIGILTDAGDLFCGDLLINQKGKPALNSLLDDPDEARASYEKLSRYPIKMVYPGHGQPFPMVQLTTAEAR